MKRNFDSSNLTREKSYMAFFQDDFKLQSNDVNVIYPEYIQIINFKKFSNELKQKRNWMIYICAIQVLACLMGMAYIVFRRSFVYFFIHFLNSFPDSNEIFISPLWISWCISLTF